MEIDRPFLKLVCFVSQSWPRVRNGNTKHTSLICEKNPFVRKCWPEVIIIIFAIDSHSLVELIFHAKKRSDVKQESKHQRLGKTSKKIPLYTDDERLYNQLNHQHHSYCYPCNQPRTFIYTANHHHHHGHHYHHHHNNNNQLYLTRVTRDSTSTE